MQNVHKKSLFSTQIYYQKLNKNVPQNVLKDIKNEVIQIMNADKPGQIWSDKNYIQGYTSYGSSSTGFDRLHLISSTFKDLEKKINQHLKKYITSLDFDIKSDDLKMTHCWVNIMGENSYHTSHNHPLSVISGTFYVDIPKGASSFKIEDPRIGLFMNTPPLKIKARLENQRQIEIQPQPGYLVLFESWLKHEVPINLSKKERISVSFNYGWN